MPQNPLQAGQVAGMRPADERTERDEDEGEDQRTGDEAACAYAARRDQSGGVQGRTSGRSAAGIASSPTA